jgi:hypothetical protein
VKTEVISFIRFKPALLSAFDAQTEVNATPRAWVEGVSANLGTIDKSIEFETFKGDVGEGPASEFTAFLKIYRDLPNPDVIIMNPAKAEVPKETSTMYALVGALSTRVTLTNFVRCMEYIKRLPPEFGVLFVRDSLKKCPEIQTTKDFIKWASTDGAKFLL